MGFESSGIFDARSDIYSYGTFSRYHGKKIDPGRVIRVGHSHSHGGADFMAKALNLYDDPEDAILYEGDFDGLDLSIRQKLVQFFYAYILYYFNPASEDYDIIKAIVQFLIEEISQRITHIMGSVWVILEGLVPSGVLETSQMDSWCVALLFYWYVSFQMRRVPHYLAKKCERWLIRCLIHILVQGDDHILRFPLCEELALWMSIEGWNLWLNKYWGMTIRDMKRVKLLSVADQHGGLIDEQVCFLKYYTVRNSLSQERGQPRYLSYRPTNDLVLRLIWSREAETRDLFDMLLSCIGHAYGTYYSNLHAYNYLAVVYSHVLLALDLTEEVAVKRMMEIKSESIQKSIRKRGLSPEMITYGFPTPAKLIELNVVDRQYEFLGAAY